MDAESSAERTRVIDTPVNHAYCARIVTPGYSTRVRPQTAAGTP